MFWGTVFGRSIWAQHLGAASGAPTLGEAMFEIGVDKFTDNV
jgi:hypothetical protein